MTIQLHSAPSFRLDGKRALVSGAGRGIGLATLWGKTLGTLLARRRWAKGEFTDPALLRMVRRLAQRVPQDSQAYGHLRDPAPARARETVA